MTPNWQPVEALPLIAGMLDDQLHCLRQQVENLKEARCRPYVLDREMVERLQRVFGEQREMLPVFREQLVRWRELSLVDEQLQETSRLDAVLDQMQAALDQILEMADSLAHLYR